MKIFVLVSLIFSQAFAVDFGSTMNDTDDTVKLATIVSGIVSQRVHSNAKLNLATSLKGKASNSLISGYTTPTEINVSNRGQFEFTGQKLPDSSYFIGQIVKNGVLNWTVQQVSESLYMIHRGAGPSYALSLQILNGRVEGVCKRPMNFDLPVTGFYDSFGGILVEFHRTVRSNIVLRGAVFQR